MSSRLAKLGDDLMKVPKLEAGSVNWVVYKDCFLWSVDARGLLKHVDGSKREPVCWVKPQMVPKKDADGNDTRETVPATYTREEERDIKEWKVELKEWKQGEAVVKQQIAATIPDSLFMKIRNKGTALEIWEALQGDFQNKSRMVSVDLRRRLQQERCAEKGDVRAHFSNLRLMREDLAAMGHAPGDDELYVIILGSLPYSFEPFISALNATSSVLGTILSPDDLMQAFTDEYERRNLGKSSKRDENTENVAFSTNEGNGWKGNGQKGNCYNCGKPGHRKDDCWEEGGGKEDQKPNWLKEKEKWRKEKQEGRKKEEEKMKAKDSAMTAMIEDMAWMAYLPDPTDDGNEPILFSDDEISLNDFVEADKEIRKEMTRGQKEPQEECYSTQDTDPASTRDWVHKTTSSKPKEKRLDWWYEPVEGEREDFDEQVNEAGNQPIPQLAKPEPEEVEWTDHDLSTTKSARDAEDQAMALWLRCRRR